MQKKFIFALIAIVFTFSGFSSMFSTPALAQGELQAVNRSYFTGKAFGFSGLTQSLRAITKNRDDVGYILRESLNESGKYEKWCSWNFAFEVFASEQPQKGDLRAADCIRFEMVNNTDHTVVYQFAIRRAFVTPAEQEAAGIKADPYEVSATDYRTNVIYDLGWFLGSAEGAFVTYEHTTRPDLNTETYIEGSYTAIGGLPTSVIEDDQVVFDAGEWGAEESKDAVTTGDAPSPSLFTAPFWYEDEGVSIITIELEAGSTATLWQGLRIPADKYEVDNTPTPTVVPSAATPQAKQPKRTS